MADKARKGQRIAARIKEAEAWRDKKYSEKWKDAYRRFCSEADKKRQGSNIFVPYTAMICEVVTARCAETIFAGRPYVTVTPRDDLATRNAIKVQAYLDFLFAEKMRIERLFTNELVPSLCIYGTVITHTSWKKRTVRKKRQIMKEVPFVDDRGEGVLDALGQPVTIKTPAVEAYSVSVYDDPQVQMIELGDFFVDPYARDLETARFCGHKEYLTEDELKAREKDLHWNIDFDKIKKTANDNAQQRRYASLDGGASYDEDFYAVSHYWSGVNHAVLIDEIIVFEEENPFFHGEIPYDMTRYSPRPGEFFGVGIPELLADLQDELNTVRNQRIDYNSMALRRMFKVRKGCGLTQKDLTWRQNGILSVENMDDVQEINIQDLPASAFANEAGIKEDMRDRSGCHDVVMGLSNADETATTTMTKDNNASIRFKQVMGGLVEDVLLPVARKCVAMEQQYMTGERSISARQDKEELGEAVTITAFDLAGEYDLNFAGTATEPTANKAQKQQQLNAFLSFASGLPIYQQESGQTALRKLIEAQLRAMDIEDPENYLPSAAPVPAAPMEGVM